MSSSSGVRHQRYILGPDRSAEAVFRRLHVPPHAVVFPHWRGTACDRLFPE